MLAQALARRFSRLGLHYGWAVVAITFVTTLVTAGAMGLPGALILPLSREFGWNTEQISGALALRILLYGLMAPFAASLIDRYGLRRVILSAVFLIAAGLLLALKMNQVWHLVLLWGVVVGLGTGLTALVMSAIVATQWFSERRGLVLGILTASSATGQLVFLPLAAWLEQRYGWRIAVTPTLIGLAVAGAAVLLFMADRPSDVGLEPYGECGRSAPPAARPVGALAVLGRNLGQRRVLDPRRDVLRLRPEHQRPHPDALHRAMPDFDVGAVAAASTLAMMGMFDFVGTIGSGWLSDRYDNRALLFCLLRPARPVAALSARLVLHDLRPVAVRRVLRPRLGRDRAADRSPDRAGVRPRARRRRFRLDFRRAHGRRLGRRLWRGLFA